MAWQNVAEANTARSQHEVAATDLERPRVAAAREAPERPQLPTLFSHL
jgi:hypothetical protein